MSETKLTRYRFSAAWCNDSTAELDRENTSTGDFETVVNWSEEYCLATDADARIAALERDHALIKEAALGERNLRLAAERDLAAANVTLGQAQSDLVGLRGRLATAERERDELRQRVEVLEAAIASRHPLGPDIYVNMGDSKTAELVSLLRTPPAAPDDDELEATDTEQHFKPCYCGGMMYKWDPTQLYRDSTDPICWRCVKCKTTSPLTAAQGAQP
jgi:hypothetical protein